MKRIISLILIAAMLTLSAVSCSDAPAETETNAPVETPGNESADAAQDAEDDKYAYAKEMYAAIPEYDFGGGDVLISTDLGWHGSEQEVTSEGMTGEGVNDAIYLRTEAVNARFDCKILRASYTNAVDSIKQNVQSGDNSLKIAFTGLCDALPLATSGYLINLLSVQNLNLDEAWYDQGTYNTQLMGKLFVINGDIHIVDDRLTYMYLFNKDMAAEHNLGDLYDLVKEGKWTIDAMKEMSEAVSNDVDGNGVYDTSDEYGYMSYNGQTDCFFYGSGLQWVTLGDDGIPVLDLDQERAVAVLEKLSTFFSSGHSHYSGGDSSSLFKNGQGLFLNEVVTYIPSMSDMEDNFGILPLPKYDEAQEQYYSFMFNSAPGTTIPNTGNDPEMIGALIEALAIQSHMLLKPAFYETALQRRYARDEKSSEMLDLIFDNRIYDFGYYAVEELSGIFGRLCFNGETTLASRYKAINKIVTNKLTEYVDAFSN